MNTPLPEHTKQANAALSAAPNKSMDVAKQCAAARKAEMTMPPLPESFPAGYIARTEYFYTADQMREYGQQCREAALEEAAQVCNGEQWHNSARPVDYIEAFNQGCGDCEAAIRRLK